MLMPALLLLDVTIQTVCVLKITKMIILDRVPPRVKETVQGWESVFEIAQVQKTEQVAPRHRNHQAAVWPHHAAYLTEQKGLVMHVLQDVQERYEIERRVRKGNLPGQWQNLIGPSVRGHGLAILVHAITSRSTQFRHASNEFTLETAAVQNHIAVANGFEGVS